MTVIEVTYTQRRLLLLATPIENRYVTEDGDILIYPLETIVFRAVKEVK